MVELPGTLLIRAGILAPQQVQAAQKLSERTGVSFTEGVIQLGFIDEDKLADFYHKRLMVPRITPDRLEKVKPDVIELVPADMASEFRVVPVEVDKEGSLVLAMADPSNNHAVDEVSFFVGKFLIRAVASASVIRNAIQDLYGSVQEVPRIKSPTPRPRSATPRPRSATPPPAEEMPIRHRKETPSFRKETPRPRKETPRPRKATPPPEEPVRARKETPRPRKETPRPRTATPAPPKKTDPVGTKAQADALMTVDEHSWITDMPAWQDGTAPRAEDAAEPESKSSMLDLPPGAADELRRVADKAALERRDTLRGLNAKTPEPPVRQLRAALTRVEVARIMLDYLDHLLRRAMLLVVRKGQFLEVNASRGFPDAGAATLSIDLEQPSLFRDVVQSLLPYRGPMPTSDVSRKIGDELEGFDGEVLVMPIRVREKIIGLLFADGAKQPLPDAALQQMTAEAGRAYERIIVSSK